MISSTVTQDNNNFKHLGNFRTAGDLSGVSWETKDEYSHNDLKYPTNCDFTGVQLQYDYEISGYTNLLNSEAGPVITIKTYKDGINNDPDNIEIYFVRLWNYVVDRPSENWELDSDNKFTNEFPKNRVAGNGNGSIGTVKLDFDNLYSGWAPYRYYLIAGWQKDPDWTKVPVNKIKRIMWSFVPVGYSGDQKEYLDNSYKYEVDFKNWSVTGNTYLCPEQVAKVPTEIRMCDDYDDIYNLTPERVVNEYNKLGYNGVVNFYVGASHYYDKKYNGSRMETITDYPFNIAFEEWYKDYVKILKSKNMDIIHSISMESVDAPESWW